MSLRKDPTVYTATLRNLKLFAWGMDQVIRESFAVTVYQVTCRPAKWAARPKLSQTGRQWSGPTAEAVMKLVREDFEELVTDWAPAPPAKAPTPSLRAAADIYTGRRRA